MAPKRLKPQWVKGHFGHHIGNLPEGLDMLVVSGNKGGGHQPLRLLMPHQVYYEDVKDIKGLVLIPVSSQDYIWLSDINKEVKGPDADS